MSSEEEEDEDYQPSDKEGNSEEETEIQKQPETEEEKKQKEIENESKKRKIDELWDKMNEKEKVFMRESKIQKTESSQTTNNQNQPINSSKIENSPQKSTTTTIVEKYDFAGETIKVTKTVPVTTNEKKKKQGLNDILNSLKPKKIGTLQKSKFDWDSFKKKEGIEDDLKQATKGGYLEKKAFLERTEVREYEHERSIRMKNKKMPDGNIS